MLHHHPAPPAKYHPHPLTQFLAMHHQHQQQQQQQNQHNHHHLHNDHHHPHHHHHHQRRGDNTSPDQATTPDDLEVAHATQLDSSSPFGPNIGKSFTIAAILGLKKNAAAAAAAVALEHQQHNYHQHHHHHHSGGGGGGAAHLHQHHQSHHHLPFHAQALSAGSSSNPTTTTTRLTDYSAVMNLSINQQSSNNNNNNNNSSTHNNNNNSNLTSREKNHLPHHLHHHPINHLVHPAHHQHLHQHQQSKPSSQQQNAATSALQSLQQQLQHQQQQQQQLGSATTGGFATRERSKISDHHSTKKTSLKGKRVRTIFTPEQLERLESEFERQQYMVGPERLYLAHTLQLTEAQVKVWFQNRRIKWRKHHLELTQQKLALIRQHQGPATASASLNSAIMTAAAADGDSSSPHRRPDGVPVEQCDAPVDVDGDREDENLFVVGDEESMDTTCSDGDGGGSGAEMV